MRPQKVLDSAVFTGLTRVIRAKGYDGASLSELAEATGLKKASLYHRFPGGKQEMAASVLAHIDEWVEQHIFQVLTEENKSPEERLSDGLAQIRILYDGGNEACIFRALSMGSGIALFQKQIADGMTKWVNAFKKIGIAFQLLPEEAEKKALEALILIQGSLIAVKGLDDTEIFENTLQKIKNGYLSG